MANDDASQPLHGSVDRSHAGEAAPDARFTDPSGKSVTLAAFRGTPVLLNLWATWCPPCVAEMPTLDTLAGDLDGKVALLAVSQDLGGKEQVAPFFAKHKFANLQPYLDQQLALSTRYGVNLPTTILYDANGKEIWRVTGGMDWTSEKARTLIAEATR
ncbi:TlpA disulfide reductase family protein [Stakelama flava]